MSSIVPIAGLVMARFHILECELRTVMEMWGSSKRNFLTQPNLIPPGKTIIDEIRQRGNKGAKSDFKVDFTSHFVVVVGCLKVTHTYRARSPWELGREGSRWRS